MTKREGGEHVFRRATGTDTVKPIISGRWPQNAVQALLQLPPEDVDPEQERESRQLANLCEIARLINESCDLDIVLNRVASAVCQHTSWASCGIMAVNREQGVSELMARYDPRLPAGADPKRWPLHNSATLRVLETNTPVIIPDAQACEEFPGYREDSKARGYRTVVILPLNASDALGREMTLAVHSREKVRVADTALSFLYTVTQLTSIAVEKAKRVHHEQEMTVRLRQTIERSAALINQALGSGTLESLVDLIETVIPNAFVVYERATNSFLARRTPEGADFSVRDWKRLVECDLRTSFIDLSERSGVGGFDVVRPLEVEAGGRAVTLHAVGAALAIEGEMVGGLIVLTDGGHIDNLSRLVAQEIKLALSVALMRNHIRRKEEARSTNAFLRALLNGRWEENSEIAARATHLGIDLDGPSHVVGVIPTAAADGAAAPARSSLIDIETELRQNSRALQSNALVACIEECVVVLFPTSDGGQPGKLSRAVKKLHEVLLERFGHEIIVAEGGMCLTGSDYRKAYLEICRVSSLAHLFKRSGVLSKFDFGHLGVLLSAAEEDAVSVFIEATLGRVENYDRQHATDLLNTIKAFIDHGYRFQACANHLGIHVSTLRYRLAKVREELNVDLEDPDARLGLALAIRLKELAASKRD